MPRPTTFTQCWIIRETALATNRRLQCDKKTVPWSRLEYALGYHIDSITVKLIKLERYIADWQEFTTMTTERIQHFLTLCHDLVTQTIQQAIFDVRWELLRTYSFESKKQKELFLWHLQRFKPAEHTRFRSAQYCPILLLNKPALHGLVQTKRLSRR